MPTDRPTDDLVERLLSAAAGVADARVERLISDAAAEAEAEVRAMVKAAVKAALLRSAAAKLAPADLPEPPEPQAASQETPAPAEAVERDARLGWYVYGITRADAAALPQNLPGVDDAYPVGLVSHDALQAIT